MRGLIKSGFSSLGIDIRFAKNIPVVRAQQKHDDLVARWRLLQRYQPATILDIGANEGQCARLLHEAFPEATILSFEPLADCFAKVQQFHTEEGSGKAFHFALGEENGSTTIHRNAFSPSSSILPMEQLHCDEFPQTVESREELIQIRCLDDVARELDLQGPFVIKADVQGFEDRVIRGGIETFSKASAAVLELTSYRLYTDQATFPAVHDQLAELGYAFRGIVDQSTSKIDGRILQFDGLFENTRLTLPGQDEVNHPVDTEA